MNDNINPTYSEFSNPDLVKLYDIICPLGKDSEFFCEIAKKVGAKSIIDLGCGTGILTCELARKDYQMIGVEPSAQMLEIAKSRPDSEKVFWINGYSDELEKKCVDLVIMTSHVAQFFLEDTDWTKSLSNIFKSLKPGGYLIFDSRNPVTKPWESWNKDSSFKTFSNEELGKIDVWYQFLKLKENRVLYEIHYYIHNTKKSFVSVNELIYRSKKELMDSLINVGFKVESVYGDWDFSLVKEDSEELLFLCKKEII